MKTQMIIALLFTTFMVSTCLAGDNLSIQLIEASNKKDATSSGVQNIISILKKSLPYNSYNLVASGSTKLPTRKTTQKLGEYIVSCSGKQKNLSIKVTRKKQTLLNTTVNLSDNKPFMLGGFPSKNGKFILVFIAK